eukprot:5295531-Prymnesium_polylepis.1
MLAASVRTCTRGRGWEDMARDRMLGDRGIGGNTACTLRMLRTGMRKLCAVQCLHASWIGIGRPLASPQRRGRPRSEWHDGARIRFLAREQCRKADRHCAINGACGRA